MAILSKGGVRTFLPLKKIVLKYSIVYKYGNVPQRRLLLKTCEFVLTFLLNNKHYFFLQYSNVSYGNYRRSSDLINPSKKIDCYQYLKTATY